jgi:GT2 family glycosyltransferase
MKASLIVSVYKDTKALEAVLNSLSVQTFQDFEIIVSEDGCSENMKEFLSVYPFRQSWQHLTQEDMGWRKNRALNRAIQAARSEYLVLVDGDCVLHPRFLEMHLRYAAPNRILAGKRIKLNEALSLALLAKAFAWSEVQPFLIRQFFQLKKMGFRFQEEGLFVNPDGFLGFIPRLRKMSQLKGCNMSFSKAAIQAINGFDEDYVRPAIGEDIDLVWRFRGAGFQLFSLRNLAVQYHLYHVENWTDQTENQRMMEEKQKKNAFVCSNGILKH